jgi:hypothetical protein
MFPVPGHFMRDVTNAQLAIMRVMTDLTRTKPPKRGAAAAAMSKQCNTSAIGARRQNR